MNGERVISKDILKTKKYLVKISDHVKLMYKISLWVPDTIGPLLVAKWEKQVINCL